jgi:tRNA A-37 threonylcarbamoyl transferase component Bud32
LTELAAGPGDSWQWLQAHGRVLKCDEYSRTALLELGGEPCFAKLYLPRSRLHGRILRTAMGRPIRSQDAARELATAAVRVPQPRGCLWVGNSALTLTEGLEGSEDLQQQWAAAIDASARRRLLSAAAQSLAQLHLGAYSHGDCKWSNLLCRDRQVYLVDLDAVRRAPAGSRRQARDLARFTLNAEELAVEPGDYQAFLDAYFAILGGQRDVVIGRMLPELRKLRDRHRRRYGDRGRPLW